MDHGQEESRYLSIARVLEAEIGEDGSPLMRLPSERVLSERFDCHRPTIRDALQYLEGRGLVFRKARSGWYVSPPRLHYDLNLAISLAEAARLQGRDLRTEVLTVDGDRQPTCREPSAKFLALRRRYLDGRPVVIERVYMLAEYQQALADADLTTPMSALLAGELGVEITHERLTLNPTGLSQPLARLFSTTVGSPILEIERIRFSGERLISVDVEFWRPDAVLVTIGTDWHTR